MSGRSAGEMLRQARESHGASLEALSTTIKVSVAKLRALEADDRVTLPDPNFNRALAMTVCRALKIDATPILAVMPAPVATVLTATKPALNEPYKDFADTGLTFDRSSHASVSIPKIPAAALASIGLLCAAALIYWVPDRSDWPFLNGVNQSEPVVAVPVQSSAASVSDSASAEAGGVSSPLASSPSAPMLVSQASAPVPPASQASSATLASTSLASTLSSAPAVNLATANKDVPVPVGAPAAGVVAPVSTTVDKASAPIGPAGKTGRMTLAAKEASWVEVRDGAGQKVFSRVIQAGETVELQGQPPLKVHAGNAPVLSLQFNGKAVDLAAVTRQNVARVELK